MKKSSERPTKQNLFLPGASLGTGPKVLDKVISQFIPELLQFPSEIIKIKHFLFQSFSRELSVQERSLGIEDLHIELKRVLPHNKKLEIECFVSILEGMQLTVEEHKMKSIDELDNFIQVNKNTFSLIIKQGKMCRGGREIQNSSRDND